MYCDFCGMKLSYNAKYCRHCGHSLSGTLENTQPLPVIDENMLYDIKQENRSYTPWYKSILKKPVRKRSKIGLIFHDLFLLSVIIGLLYIFITFKTVEEYQSLTGLWGILLLIYIWWKR
jgi:uncharacterized membrane protein YvbJ